MVIKKEDRINKESTISRLMQQNVPSKNLDNTFVKNPDLTQFDTIDSKIIDNLRKENVVITQGLMRRDSDALYNIQIDNSGITVEEPKPTSQLSEYNKQRVIIDREDNVLLFDWTEGNKRIFLHHPSGSYFTITDTGSYIFKAKSDFIAFIEGSENHIIGGDRNKKIIGTQNEQITESYNLSINANHDLSIGSNRTTIIEGNDSTQISIDKITVIDGNEVNNVSGFKEQNIGGPYIINGSDTILFDAPTIILRTSNLQYDNKANFRENIGGAREIRAATIGLTSLNNINISAGQSYSLSVTGGYEETVLGASIPPPTVAKKTRILLGDYLLDCLAGNIDIQNLLTSLSLSITGSAKLSGLLGHIDIPVTGITEIEGATLIKIGSGASEPAVLGQGYAIWQSLHQHPTAVGPSGPPLTAADIFNHLSMKVLVE